MRSEWVKTELRSARMREHQEHRKILLPVALVSMEEVKKWECFDAEIGKDIAVELREYFIPDFSKWHIAEHFGPPFAKVLNALAIERPTRALDAQEATSVVVWSRRRE
jgi:hypothetical protein